MYSAFPHTMGSITWEIRKGSFPSFAGRTAMMSRPRSMASRRAVPSGGRDDEEVDSGGSAGGEEEDGEEEVIVPGRKEMWGEARWGSSGQGQG
jgi:hypothetical protein